MKIEIRRCLCLIGAYVIVTAGLAAQTQTPPTRTREMLISVVARVEAINLTTREVTLKESTGRIDTFTVDKRVIAMANGVFNILKSE